MPRAIDVMLICGNSAGTGVGRSVVVPSPSCPPRFCPQQYGRPVDVTAQVWFGPANTETNVTPSGVAARIAVSWGASLPSPSIPAPLAPQQYTEPPVEEAQVWTPPALREEMSNPMPKAALSASIPAAVAISVYSLATWSRRRSSNVATPSTASTTMVPVNVVPEGLMPMRTATRVVASDMVLPSASWIDTVGGGRIGVPGSERLG
jgi:hypothetical protein